jgi:glutathione S-transferase
VTNALAAQLEKTPYLCGDTFSAADVYVGSQIGYGMRFHTIEERPVFADYWGRISARPALARSTAKNDALLPKG